MPPSEPPDAEPVRTVAGDGYALSVPNGPEWSVGTPHKGNHGLQIHRLVRGPSGIVIRIVHTPDDPAAPDPHTVYDNTGTLETAAEQSAVVTLKDFPTPECEARLCDDFVLTDPAFGGIAILANDDGDEPAAVAARAMAESIEPG